ncbi:hypothetical protein [Bradyrhizobium cosmicum]|nr:hypothetical protein [Bradyrhizobium cosmicum]
MTQLMSLSYTIKAKGCVTDSPHLAENVRGRPADTGTRGKQKGRREAGLS